MKPLNATILLGAFVCTILFSGLAHAQMEGNLGSGLGSQGRLKRRTT